MSVAATSLEAGCFHVPAFVVASEEMQTLVEHASRAIQDDSFAADGLAAIASRLPKGDLASDATILVPERAPLVGEEEL